MSATSIQWTDHSVNPIRLGKGHYCQKISSGCANCYASALQPRFGNEQFPGAGSAWPKDLWFDESKLLEVMRRKKPTKYFWCDMTDMFGEWVKDEWIDLCFATMQETPWHIHQVLTKRPERLKHYMVMSQTKILPNVWLGTSVENQSNADNRIPWLLATPAAVRFLSVEPLLGSVNLRMLCNGDESEIDCLTGKINYTMQHLAIKPTNINKIHWVIVGGESGRNARPCNVNWVRCIVNQCQETGVACFVKQLGGKIQIYNDSLSEWPFDGDKLIEFAPNKMPRFQGENILVRCEDSKGGDMAEWPEDLRVRQFPGKPLMEVLV